MNRFLSVFFVLTFIFSCKNKGEEINIVQTSLQNSNVIFHPDYQTFKSDVLKMKKEYRSKSKKEQSNLLYQLVSDDIYYYWRGTTWDFNGTTQEPGEGNIACGYFVTNTLADVGFKIERTKLAQAASSKMINELCVDIKRFAKISDLQKYLETQPNNSAFIVGLDFHTGYILKEETGNYFLHSNYIDKKGVMKEKITKSSALKSSKSFMIGNLTANEKLLQTWLNN